MQWSFQTEIILKFYKFWQDQTVVIEILFYKYKTK